MKIYVSGVHAPRFGDKYDFVQGSHIDGACTSSYAEEPDDNKPNAVFSLALAQPVMLVDVEQGKPIHVLYGGQEFLRSWQTNPDLSKKYEECNTSKNLEAACRSMAKESRVKAAVMECLVHAVAQTWKILHRAITLLQMPFGTAKSLAPDVWEALVMHLTSKAKNTHTQIAEIADTISQLKLRVDTTEGSERTDIEISVMQDMPEGTTSREIIVSPVVRHLLARDVKNCSDTADVACVQERHKVRCVMLNEVTAPVFTEWKCKELMQAVLMWLAKTVPPFTRQDTVTKKNVEIMQRALVRTGLRDSVGQVAVKEQLIVGLGVAMLAGITVNASLASFGFMNGSDGVSDYVLPDYVHYAEEFEVQETNKGLLDACMAKWESLNSGPSAAGRNLMVPMPTMWGLHVCNSLIEEGYLSMLYVTGTLGTAGYIITKLVRLWLQGGTEGNLLTNALKWKNWLSLKLKALRSTITNDGVRYDTPTRVLLKNSDELIGAHFFPGRGPETCQDVKVLGTELMLRFWAIVKKGEREGGYVLNNMCQQYKMASKRAGERDDRTLKTCVVLENAAEMVYDGSLLYATVDLVVKGVTPSKGNVEAHRESTRAILDVVVGTNRDARRIAEVFNGGVSETAPVDGARRIVAVGQTVNRPVQMRDDKKNSGSSLVWSRKHNALLADTVFQVVGKGMCGADLYPKRTLYDALVSVGAHAAKRWDKSTLMNAVTDWYASADMEDGSTTWEEAYSTKGWTELWSQQAGAPNVDGMNGAKRKSTRGNTH
jgi:hypothetical protein